MAERGQARARLNPQRAASGCGFDPVGADCEPVRRTLPARWPVVLACIANAMHALQAMKTASLPSVRVDPRLRKAAEAVLREGESLSSFVEQSLKDEVTRREQQRAFIARGLAARDEARRKDEYFDADEVHAELRRMLAKASRKGRS